MAFSTTDKPRTRDRRVTILLTEDEARQWEEHVRAQAEPGERPNASRVFRAMLRDRGILRPAEKKSAKSAQGG